MARNFEAELIRERNRLAAILDGTNIGTWEWNVQTAETSFNERWAEIIGYNLEEILPANINTWEKFTHPEDLKRANQKIEQHFKKETEHYECEIRMMHKTGHWIWVLDRGKVATWTDDGRPEWMYGTHQEITERKTSELQLTALIDNISEGIVIENSSRKIESANNFFYELFEYPQGTDITGKDSQDVIETVAKQCSDPEQFIKRVKEIKENGKPVSKEPWSLRNGKYIERDFFPITQDLDTELYYWVHRDVTHQKELEMQLRQNEQNFENFFNTNLDFLWVLDEKGTIIEVNETVIARLGYTEQELVGKPIFPLLPATHREKAADFLNRNLSNPLFESDKTRNMPLITKNGDPIPVETHFFSGQWNGRSVLFGVCRDITGLVLSEEKFSKAFKSSPVSVSLSDKLTGEFIEVNDAFCKMFNIKTEDIIGKTIMDIVQVEEQEEDSFFRRYRELKTLRNEESRLTRLDGKEIDLLLSIDLIKIQDKKYNFVTAIDITELKKTIEEKNLLMKELNHRVKNNMIMISSLISLKAMETNIDLSDVENQIDAIRLVHESLYKTENYAEVNLATYVQELLEKIFTSLTVRPVRIINRINNIHINTKRALPVGLIINEIATNAIKHGFTDTANAAFTVAMETDVNNEDYILTLSNNGEPFPEDKSIDNADSLGLRLISTLVTQLNGTIKLKKKPHPIFTIRFSSKV